MFYRYRRTDIPGVKAHANDMAHVLQMFFSSDIPDVKVPYLTCQ